MYFKEGRFFGGRALSVGGRHLCEQDGRVGLAFLSDWSKATKWYVRAPTVKDGRGRFLAGDPKGRSPSVHQTSARPPSPDHPRGARPMEATLVRIDVTRDANDRGERRWLVTPLYRRGGRLMTIPDGRGWPTLEEARAEAERIGGGPCRA
jgi:hypothetical protein